MEMRAIMTPESTRDMTSTLRTLVEHTFAVVEAKDLDAVLACCADDAVFLDPHYPVPRMAGKAAIAEGLRWGFSNMQKMSFPIVNYFEDATGQKAVVEVATAHVLSTGMKLDFPQVFVIEARDGRITRLQAYEPYGPPGILGLFLGFTRLSWRLSGKTR
jgi:ketosteroid isomerase-like protein